MGLNKYHLSLPLCFFVKNEEQIIVFEWRLVVNSGIKRIANVSKTIVASYPPLDPRLQKYCKLLYYFRTIKERLY